MADKKISELPLATTPLAGTEEQEIIQGGVNKRVAVSEVGGGGGVVETIVAGTNITVDSTDPANPIVSATGGGGGTVTSVSGTSNRITSTGGATPVIDISSTYDTAITSAINAKVTDAIVDGVTTVAPSQNAVFDALALKSPLASPTFTGIPTAPTAAPGTNTTQIATTAFVSAQQIFVNVKDFGAVGNGVANDATAIQNAINTGNAVFFPAGTYLVSTGLTMTTNNQQIIGYAGAFIKATTNINILTASFCENVVLNGINFLGNNTTGQKGLVLNNTQRVKIIACGALNLDYGFYFMPSAVESIFGVDVPIPTLVSSCVVSANSTAGMYWEAGAEYYDVNACNIYKNTTGYGCWIKSGNVSLTSNTINANNIGVYVDGIYNSGNTDHGTIVGNKINHNRQCGLWIKSTQFSQHVTGNDIWANIGDGTGAGNFGALGTSLGVYLQSADAINFTGNVIARNKVNLGYDGLTNSIISMNTFITDSTRTTSHLKSYGFASEKFSINGLNIIGNNAFVGAYTGAVTKKYEPNTTAGKEQGTITMTNVGTTQADYVALTSGSTAFDLDGSQNTIHLTSGYTGTFTVRTGRTQQPTKIFFTSVSGGTKVMAFANNGSTTITSYTPGASVSSLNVTLSITGTYFIIPLTGDNYAIFGPSGKVVLSAGTATAATAPLKLTAGTNLTTPEAGAIEFDGTNYFATISTTRHTLAKTLTATATLNFDLTAVNYQDLTITVTGAADGDAVVIGVPNGAVVADITYFGWVSATNTVSIRASRVGGGGAADPASGTFRASVIKY